MAIKFMAPNANQGASDDIVGELVSGCGRVPDYVDFGTGAIRTDDKELAEQIVAKFGGSLEEHEGRRNHYAVLPEGFWLEIVGTYMRTAMLLRSRNDGTVLRQCDGETMKDGKECVCIRDYAPGSDEWRQAAKENLACKPDGLLFFNLADVDGKFVFSKGSESTVRAFIDLEGALPEKFQSFETSVHIKPITSKKTGYSWSVPEFSAPTNVVVDS